MSYAPFNYKSTSSTRSHTHPGSASGVDTECPKGREGLEVPIPRRETRRFRVLD
jgi:hypothetical protein